MNKNDFSACFSQQAFWEHLADSQRALLLENARQVHYSREDAILSEHNSCPGIFFTRSGVLRIFLLAQDGRQITVSRLHAGDPCVLTASCALPSLTFEVQIDAEEDCDLLLVPTQIFSRLMQENIYLEAFAYRLTCEHFSDIMNAVERIFFLSLEQRIAAFLLDESAERGTAVLPFTQEKLAMAIGSAREAVSRTLKQFSQEKSVALSRGCIRILDKNALYQKLSLT